MSVPLIVDDSSPSVVYSATGWTIQTGLVPAFNQTLHVTSEKDASVSLTFEGTGIEVFTSRAPTSTGGRPTTSYSIDGGAYVKVVNEPLHNPLMLFNIIGFLLTDMPSGVHVLNISNLNGTSPNTFFLDYFLIYGSLPSTTGESSTGTVVESSTGTAVESSTRTLGSSTWTLGSSTRTLGSSTQTLGSSTRTGESSTSTDSATQMTPTTNEGRRRSSTSHAGIIGGVVGGAVGLILIAIAVLLWWRRWRRAAVWSDSDSSRRTPMLSTTPGSASSAEPQQVLLHVHRPLSCESSLQVQCSMPAAALERSCHSGESARPSSPAATAATSTSPSEMLRGEIARLPWYTSPERQTGAQSLLRGMAARRNKQQRRRSLPPRGPSIDGVEEQDSGLRLYSEDTSPPRYTAE
ncbi:hypothetical protein L226DRAFT_139358 [Lentinus tigrinus ALCF2SS1-7]|uniref:Transmembrane protein n=1 Tax=Lentinus tigrinus ALCF2SS1-6 TaxID=1328759 RepID=A0A5C2T7G6_9APHY|nr:hypothetical protein L227DRAFT_28363 [Lentinus tigrinus ALCF2SS1-6]RPD81483.1 hypothetical protein L226DRAFT_139358 [Lentinus tigrinus ALCF2SS1-7]